MQRRTSWSIDKETKNKIFSLRKQGFKLKEIAIQLNMELVTINTVLYYKTRKKSIKKYYDKNRDKIKEQMRKYQKKYYARKKLQK